MKGRPHEEDRIVGSDHTGFDSFLWTHTNVDSCARLYSVIIQCI